MSLTMRNRTSRCRRRELPASAPSWSYAAYDLATTAVGLAVLPLVPFVLFSRHGRGLSERLGRLPPAVRRVRRPIWVHAASVGEVLAAQPLIEALRTDRADVPIVVSTTSVPGRETARARLSVDAVMLLPVDVRWIVESVLRRVQPACLVIVETEIWPALIRAAARRRVPVCMVSGRVSAAAAARYARLRWLTRPVLSQVSAFAMQTAADAARIVELGAPPARVHVLGSLKFAREATAPASVDTPDAVPWMRVNGRPLLVAASTHAGEERLVLDACAELWAAHPDVLLLIAPRRPERFDEVDQLLARAGARHVRRSQLHGAVDRTTRVLLLDTLGELPTVLPAAAAVFVGGTIVPLGGHNVLEPALFGKPVAFGPYTANVAAAAEALLNGLAATRVTGAAALAAEWQRLLEQPAAAAAMGARGRAIVAAHAEVAARTAELVRRCLADGKRQAAPTD
jgi:3-deoxy-D-manno-octulosonic-acid transferase